jgi:drug/metabolite transporter (DMT)-like permease
MLMLLAISLIAGEHWVSPLASAALPAYLYLVLVGTVGLFYLYLYVLNRWSASATSYSFLLFPVSTVSLGALLAGEQVSIRFLFGAVLVMGGVWIGAFRQH